MGVTTGNKAATQARDGAHGDIVTLSEVELIRKARAAKLAERAAEEERERALERGRDPEDYSCGRRDDHASSAERPFPVDSRAYALAHIPLTSPRDMEESVVRMMPLAVATLCDIMEGGNASEGTRYKTATYIVDRVLGKPTVVEEHYFGDGPRNKRIVVTAAARPADVDMTGVISDASFSG